MNFVFVNSMGEYSRVFTSRKKAEEWRERQMFPREWRMLETWF